MAWTAPLTWLAGQPLYAAQLNTQLRDNFLELDVSHAAMPGGIIVGVGANALGERVPGSLSVVTQESTSSTSYVGLTTPVAVTVNTDTQALVISSCKIMNSGDDIPGYASWAVSGATTIAVSDNWALRTDAGVSAIGVSFSSINLIATLTPGTNTFTHNYKVASHTGFFSCRALTVIPL